MEDGFPLLKSGCFCIASRRSTAFSMEGKSSVIVAVHAVIKHLH